MNWGRGRTRESPAEESDERLTGADILTEGDDRGRTLTGGSVQGDLRPRPLRSRSEDPPDSSTLSENPFLEETRPSRKRPKGERERNEEVKVGDW